MERRYIPDDHYATFGQLGSLLPLPGGIGTWAAFLGTEVLCKPKGLPAILAYIATFYTPAGSILQVRAYPPIGYLTFLMVPTRRTFTVEHSILLGKLVAAVEHDTAPGWQQRVVDLLAIIRMENGL